MARVAAFATVGVDPSIMGIGPVPAIENVLKLSGKTLNDIDLIEVSCIINYCILLWVSYYFDLLQTTV